MKQKKEDSLLFLPLFTNGLLPTAVTHGNVRIVASDEDLTALCHHVSFPVDAGVDNRLFAAGANGLDLGDRVRDLKKTAASLKQAGKEIGTKTKAKHGNVAFVYDPAKLIDLRRREELTFVRNDHMVLILLKECLVKIGIAGHHVSLLRKTDAGTNDANTVSIVKGRLDQPNPHSPFLIVKLGYESVCRFGGAHRSVFEIKLCHFIFLPFAFFPILRSS
jgi:hypothetical protein